MEVSATRESERKHTRRIGSKIETAFEFGNSLQEATNSKPSETKKGINHWRRPEIPRTKVHEKRTSNNRNTISKILTSVLHTCDLSAIKCFRFGGSNCCGLLGVLSSESVLVPTHDAIVYSLVEDIDLCLGEVPCADLAFEQKIELSKRTAAWFGNTEVGLG